MECGSGGIPIWVQTKKRFFLFWKRLPIETAASSVGGLLSQTHQKFTKGLLFHRKVLQKWEKKFPLENFCQTASVCWKRQRCCRRQRRHRRCRRCRRCHGCRQRRRNLLIFCVSIFPLLESMKKIFNQSVPVSTQLWRERSLTANELSRSLKVVRVTKCLVKSRPLWPKRPCLTIFVFIPRQMNQLALNELTDNCVV